MAADAGVTEDVDRELSSNAKSKEAEEAESNEGDFASTMVATLFLLTLTDLPVPESENLEPAKFSSLEFSRQCDSLRFGSIRLLSQGFVAIHPSI